MNPYNNISNDKKLYAAGEFYPPYKATHPTDKIVIEKRIFVVDSRQRDCKAYPSPSFYRIPVPEIYKNVTSIELKGTILPKTAYNVHDSNNCIDFSIGDSVTQIEIRNGGSGYNPLSPPTVTISDPVLGTTAIATATVNNRGSVSNITIGIPGSGYRHTTPPFVTIQSPPNNGTQATAVATIGTVYKATLRVGNYTMGGNNESGVTVVPSGLLLEIQNAMNYAVNGAPYDPASVSPFAVRLVSQYPELGAAAGTPESFDTNACLYNRIQIVNTNGDHWELLWCSGRHKELSSRRILGFPWVDQSEPVVTAAVDPGGGDIIPAGTSYRSSYDWDLMDDPNYAILSFWAIAEDSFNRLSSPEGSGLNRAFATMVYDANGPDNLLDLDGATNSVVGGVNYLDGELSKGSFYCKPGNTKPLKGFDFDKKYLEFSPPIGKLSYLNIKFNKFGTKDGGQPNLYDFQGRDHLLIFEISSSNSASGLQIS